MITAMNMFEVYSGCLLSYPAHAKYQLSNTTQASNVWVIVHIVIGKNKDWFQVSKWSSILAMITLKYLIRKKSELDSSYDSSCVDATCIAYID